MADELYVLSLDCERTGQNVPSGPDGALRAGPITAIGCAVGRFNSHGGLTFVPGFDLQLSFAPAASDYDADTHAWWHRPENIDSHDFLIAQANCKDERDMLRQFWDYWRRVTTEYPGIVVVSDCVAFDVGYLHTRALTLLDPLALPLTHQPQADGTTRFVNTFDAGTLEKLARAKCGQPAIDAIYEIAPVKHTHKPLDDAINTLYMMEGCARLLGVSIVQIKK